MRIRSENIRAIDGVERIQMSIILRTYKLDMAWGQRIRLGGE